MSIERQALPVTLRPITAADEPFLAALYASTRAQEMALVDWNEYQRQAFLSQQFQAQQAHYQGYFPDGEHQLILSGDMPIGRIYLERGATGFHLLDIALLPAWRGQGIGGALMQEVLAEARIAGLPITLHVYQLDGHVMAWYQRLGFNTIGGSGLYALLEWRPDAISS